MRLFAAIFIRVHSIPNNSFCHDLTRDDMFEQMLQEPEEIATKRKRTREMLRVLQQAFRVSCCSSNMYFVVLIFSQ